MDLLAWWNLIFVLPAVAAVLYLGLLAAGAVDPGSDADVDADVDADLDHGIEHSLGSDHEQSGSTVNSALTFLGFGQVPLSLLLLSLCLLWGFAGWASNTLLKDALDRPAIFFVISLVIATNVALLGTRYLARGIAKILPATESYGSTEHDLVGRLAKVRDRVTERQGRAQLYDAHGSLQEVPCRIKPGEEEIPPRTEVVLLSYDRAKGIYYVLADPLGEGERAKTLATG
jgi:hypothetical protein